MSPAAQSRSTLREYVAALRRRWTYVAGAVVVAVLVAAIYSYTRTPMYEAFARLTYQKQADLSSLMTGSQPIVSSVDVQRELETYSSLMTTAEMADRARKELGLPEDASLGVTISALPVKDTSVMQIRGVSDDPEVAQRGANAYAAGFVAWRKQVAVDQNRDAQRAVLKKLGQYKTETERQDPGYFSLQSRLEDLRVLEATAQGNFTIVSVAELPTQPFEPQHPRDVVLGLLVGLLVGVFLVAVAEQLDIRVHTVDEVGAALGLPILARIPRLSGNGGAGPVTLTDPVGPNAEAYRIFRGNLDFADIDGGVRTLMMTSAVQGEGKSTTAANLAVTAALAGKQVILVDADLRRASVHRLFGLKNISGLSSVLTGRTTLSEALHKVTLPGGDEAEPGVKRGLSVLTSGPLPPNPGEIAGSQRLSDLITSLTALADLVIVDAPPFLVVGDSGALSRAVDGVVVVARLGSITRAVAHDSREFLATLPCRVLGVAVVGIPAESAAYRYRYYSDARADESQEQPAAPEEPFADPLLPAGKSGSLQID